MSASAVLNHSKAGFTDAQVTALAEYFDSQMATKGDIAELKLDIADVKLEIEKVRSELKLDIEKVRSDLDVKIADTRTDLIKWLVGLAIAQGAAIVGLVKLLPGMHS
ncbi:MAG TPA: hypothetical protein VFC56_14095 [Stellaceae bacterium]|nr:hypothetical protein [Stellaceae bacterium]